MKETPAQPDTDARANLQWTNHLLDADPHNAALWLKKVHYFRKAMEGTIPRRQLLQRELLWCEQCLRIEPDNWIHHCNVACVLRDMNRYAEAVEYLRKAVELEPNKVLPRDLLVQTLVRLGRWQQAEQARADAVRHGCPVKSLPRSDFPEDHRLDDLYRNPDATPREMMKNMVILMEAADPELFVLQRETDLLIYLGLFRVAEDCCIEFEVTRGPIALTRSIIRWARLRETISKSDSHKPICLTPAFPLLDIAFQYGFDEYYDVVQSLFMQRDLAQHMTIEAVDAFDNGIRGFLGQIQEPVFPFDDLTSLTKNLSQTNTFVRAWTMASLNFIVARRMGDATLIAYTATTLAEIYSLWGSPRLPTILYTVAAAQAEKASLWDYCVNAHGKAAAQLRSRGELGTATRHMRRALRAVHAIQPMNQFDLYCMLAECLSGLRQVEEAKQAYLSALAVEGVPLQERESAYFALALLEGIANRKVAEIAVPPIVCHDMELKEVPLKRAGDISVMVTTSKHELYDSVLQRFDDEYVVRQSIVDRRTGRAYFEDSAALCDLLVSLALEIDLPGNALMHLEMQKSIILNNRLKYLVREKPADLPDALWEDLQRLVSAHRRVVEDADDLESDCETFVEFTPDGLSDAIDAKLWECSQISRVGARQLQQKLASGRFPQAIECVDPEGTRILEFCPGTCFVIRPDAPRVPEAIPLPEATPLECQRLANELLNIVQKWRSHCTKTGSLSTAMFEDQFHALLKRLDAVLYRPVADALTKSCIHNLCIVPHSALHVLPLNLLGWSQDPLACLGDRFDVSFAPSLTSLQSLGGTPSRKHERVLIIANPIPRCPETVCHNPSRNCYSLRGGEVESDILERFLAGAGIESIRVPGPDGPATIAAVSAELGSVDIVHMAAHGTYERDHPEASGIILSLPETTRADGLARYWPHDGATSSESFETAVGEILSLQFIWREIDMFRCRLLNLSSCSSALVDWSGRSDEYYGLVNGFLYAGVQNILSNIWPINDHVSRVFNEQYYAALIPGTELAKRRKNRPSARDVSVHCDQRPRDIPLSGNSQTSSEIAALRRAVQGVRNYTIRAKKPFAHPLFWAGYRIIGFS
ncbi:CHAT domain-containing protein [Mesorhizobium sp.]|uniref:CHAT domain-containing protein n=1 Tax=Mesorhizobium sp. TaxID=1871066 RepID=UPI00257B4B6E|nr:CHAT domain-containing protein [Mesorhizobium sp.]